MYVVMLWSKCATPTNRAVEVFTNALLDLSTENCIGESVAQNNTAIDFLIKYSFEKLNAVLR